MDHLSSLPAELIDNVCGHLPRKYDVQQLRLTSRQLCRSSQHAFDDRHFKVIRCMNTRDSLERLLDFVRNERVCKAVRELEIFPFLLMSKSAPRRFSVEPCTEGEKTKFANIHQVISDDPSQIHTQLSIQGQPGQSGPHPKYMEYDRMLRQRRRESYHKQRRDQAALVASGLDVKLLAKALRTLPALKSIKVVDRTEGDIDLPFGAMQFRRETGTPRPTTLNYTASEYLYLQLGAYTVSLILGALLQSNTDLEILAFCKMPYRPAEARDARSRKSSLTAAGSLKQRQMVDLKLSDIHNFALETWSFQYTLCSTYATDTATTWFVPLISRLISVRDLTVSTTLSDIGDDYLHLLAHIGYSALPQLRSLEILGRKFSSTNVHSLIVRFGATLRRLTIDESDTLDENPVSTLPLLKGLPCMTFFRFCCPPYKETIIAGETVGEFQKILSAQELEYIDEFSFSEISESDAEVD